MTNLRLANLASALVPGLGTAVTESAVRLEGALFVSDLARCLVGMSRRKRKCLAGSRGGKVVALQRYSRFSKTLKVEMKPQTRTVESPFLGLLALRGKTTSLVL